MEGDSGPAIAAEGALVPAVVVIVTVTVAAAPGEPAAPREPATPAFGVAVPVVSDGENTAVGDAVTVGDGIVGVVGDAPGEVAR